MRVLVDTNIWIDHLRKTEPVLVDLLERDQVCMHQSVITELALGNLKNRSFFLKMLERLMIVRNVDDQGVRHLVEERHLWGKGLSAVDVALLASAVVTPGVSLWTRDKRGSGRVARGRGPALLSGECECESCRRSPGW